jgi:hypothetical protein
MHVDCLTAPLRVRPRHGAVDKCGPLPGGLSGLIVPIDRHLVTCFVAPVSPSQSSSGALVDCRTSGLNMLRLHCGSSWRIGSSVRGSIQRRFTQQRRLE